MPQGAALTGASSTEVVSAYAAPSMVIPSVLATPGWYVVGEFFLPLSADARLDVIGHVSENGNELHVRLFDMTALAPVSGSQVTITEEASTRRLSGVLSLTGQRRYQVQAESINAEVGEDEFSVVLTASLAE